MNAKQSLKVVAKKLEDAEAVVKRQSSDIAQYNRCIDSMIQGYGPCPWCEEFLECERKEKENFEGCSDWWLAYNVEKNMEALKNDTDSATENPNGGALAGAGGGISGASTGSAEIQKSGDAEQPDTTEPG